MTGEQSSLLPGDEAAFSPWAASQGTQFHREPLPKELSVGGELAGSEAHRQRRQGLDVTLLLVTFFLAGTHGVRTSSVHQDTASLHAGNTAAAWQGRWRANTGLGWASAQDSGHSLPPPPSRIRINNGIYVGAQEEQASLNLTCLRHTHSFESQRREKAPAFSVNLLWHVFGGGAAFTAPLLHDPLTSLNG